MANTHWERWLGELKYQRLLDLAEAYGNEFIEIYTRELQSRGYKATGKLLEVKTKVRKGTDVLTITFNTQDYWKWVEFGRLNGKRPPVDAILKWIQDKQLPIEPRLDKNGKTYLPTEKQLAFLISRSIGEKGTIKREGYKGSDIISDAVEQLNAKYESLFILAIEEDITEGLTGALNEILEPFK